MANRPVRASRATKNASKAKLTQVEINRVKPTGVLSLKVLEEKSSVIKTINVKFPDGEIYEFYHYPQTTGDSEDFLAAATGKDANIVLATRKFLAASLVNKDGTPFVEKESDLRTVSWEALSAIQDAIRESNRTEPGED